MLSFTLTAWTHYCLWWASSFFIFFSRGIVKTVDYTAPVNISGLSFNLCNLVLSHTVPGHDLGVRAPQGPLPACSLEAASKIRRLKGLLTGTSATSCQLAFRVQKSPWRCLSRGGIPAHGSAGAVGDNKHCRKKGTVFPARNSLWCRLSLASLNWKILW